MYVSADKIMVIRIVILHMKLVVCELSADKIMVIRIVILDIYNGVLADFPVPQYHELFQLKLVLGKIECMQ